MIITHISDLSHKPGDIIRLEEVRDQEEFHWLEYETYTYKRIGDDIYHYGHRDDWELVTENYWPDTNEFDPGEVKITAHKE